METIKYPTKNGIMNFADGTVYLRADDDTVNQYCTEKSYTLEYYESEEQRFSNDGALAYMYYGVNPGITGVTNWYMEFGFSKIVETLVVT
jgi:hypothetical protein